MAQNILGSRVQKLNGFYVTHYGKAESAKTWIVVGNIALPQPNLNLNLTSTPPLPQPNLNLSLMVGGELLCLVPSRLSRLSISSRLASKAFTLKQAKQYQYWL